MKSAALASLSFTALFAAPLMFPKQKWLGLAASIFGLCQVFAHWVGMPLYLVRGVAGG